MKNNLLLILVVAVVGLGSSCKGQTATQKLNPENFEKKLNATSAKIVLDVRTQNEYKEGHLSDATLIDYHKSDFKKQLVKLDKNKPVFVYCAGGGRSGSASKVLIDLGFKEVYDLQGGFNAWRKAKKPIKK